MRGATNTPLPLWHGTLWAIWPNFYPRMKNELHVASERRNMKLSIPPGGMMSSSLAGFDTAESIVRQHRQHNILHDIANILSSARGYLRLSLEQPPMNPPSSSRDHLEAALRNLEKLSKMIQELRDLAEPSGLMFTSVHVGQLLQNVLTEYGPMFRQKKIQLIHTDSSYRLTTIGDHQRLRETLRDLILGVVELTHFGGQSEIDVREEEEKITLRLVAKGVGAATAENPPDLSVAFEMLRLHGGTAFAGSLMPGEYAIVVELPVIRLPGC